ncbi:MAG: hypothetical protein PHR06_00565 [Candidatus Cloacimonetes bacterium]|nr:hypothetical protein [Candidatus Cloacimonadota bacterium]
MFKRYLTLLILISIAVSINAQMAANRIKQLKNSENIVYGEATASTFREADNQALRNLVSQISVTVEHQFEDIITESQGNVREYSQSVLHTYCNTTLNNARSIVDEESYAPQIYVIRYLEVEDLNELFSARKNKILTLVREGIQAENELRIADALRNYYWAFRLLRTHPDNQKITFNFDSRNELVLYPALYNRILRVFSLLKIDLKKIEVNKEENFKEYYLDIAYGNDSKPVQNLTFRYHDGYGYSKPQNIRDGLGYTELHAEAARSLNRLRVTVEYEFINHITDKEIRQVMEDIPPYYFMENNYQIALDNCPEQEAPLTHEIKSNTVSDDISAEEMNNYLDIIKKIIKAIEIKDYNSVEKYFTVNGWETFTGIVKYGNAVVLCEEMNLTFARLQDEVIARDILMKFSFDTNKEEFTEKVVFTFRDKKVESLSFALSDAAVNDIMNRPEQYASLAEKLQIIQFMETYKSAYCLKRLDFIQSIFSDDALIIIGQIMEKDPEVDVEGLISRISADNVRYFRKTKTEYVEHLSKVFQSQEVINIRFEDNILQSVQQGGRIFGIQIAQYYYSTNYADKGYLFLMFDLTDSQKPRILVRSWQPEKNADGSIIGLTDFEF